MAVLLRSRTVASGASAITLTLPTGWQPNDIFVIICETSGGENVATPSGYTPLDQSPQNTAQTRLTIFWKRAVVGEASVNIADPGDHIVATLIAFSGAINTGSPFDVIAGDNTGSTSSTSVVFPVITPTVKDAMCVNVVAVGTDSLTDQLSSFSAPQLSLPQNYFSMTTTNNGGGFSFITGTAASGVSVATTGTISTTSQQARISFAIIPDANADADQQVSRVTLGVAALTIEQNVLSVPRATLGVVTLIAEQDVMFVPRISIGFVVDIAPTSERRRGFFTFDP